MATRMMLRTSKNNAPVLQLLSVMKDKTVYKRFPTFVEPSDFPGGFWSRNGPEECRTDEVKDGFIMEMRKMGLCGGGLELFNGKSIGVEVRGRRMVSDEDEDEDEDEEDVDSEEVDDFGDDDGGDDDDDDEDGDFDGDKDEEEYVRKFRK